MLKTLFDWADRNPRLFLVSCGFWLILATLLTHCFRPLW